MAVTEFLLAHSTAGPVVLRNNHVSHWLRAYSVPGFVIYGNDLIQSSPQSCAIGVLIISILQKEKLSLREVKGPAQSHTASMWQNQHSDPGLPA